MSDRPTDFEIATYINDLELALADAEAPCRTDTHLLGTVRPWAATITGREGPELSQVLAVD